MLLLKDGLLVKTRRFKKPRYVGDPVNAIKIFNEKEVDEVFIVDMDACHGSGLPNYRLVEELAGEAFMPVAYSGGVGSPEVGRRVIALGVEKVVVTSAWHRDGELIPSLASLLGSQAVVGGIDYAAGRGGWRTFIDGGGRRTSLSLEQATDRLHGMGVGELLIQSIDRDGVMSGLDLGAVAAVSSRSTVPVVSLGGAGSVENLGQALKAGAAAVAASSMFVFHGKHRAVLITYPSRDVILGLSSGISP